MSLKDEYVALMISRFKRWDAEFGMLSEQQEQAGDTRNGRLLQQCQALRTDRDAAY